MSGGVDEKAGGGRGEGSVNRLVRVTGDAGQSRGGWETDAI